ncbi:hypothetical protein Bbelb_018890 [Branchiostoma belcheri]|nr:hypothetical protein Bbelb_018890 [Branchiostoma belcheri]
MQVRLLSDDLTSIASTVAPNVTHQQLQTEHDFDSEGLHLDAQWTAQNAEQAVAAAQPHRVDMASSENLTMLHDDSLAWNTLSRYTMTDEAFYDALSNMSHDQQQVFNTVKQHFLLLNRHQADQASPKPQPLRLFVTGGAGCGKSFLIKVLNEYLIRTSNCPTSSVMLTAPTGVAAYNIGGSTLHDHSTFTPVVHVEPPQLTTLPALQSCVQYPPQLTTVPALQSCMLITPSADHSICTPMKHAEPHHSADHKVMQQYPHQLTTVPGLPCHACSTHSTLTTGPGLTSLHAVPTQLVTVYPNSFQSQKF